MRLSSSSLDIARARISCSLRSANRFNGFPLKTFIMCRATAYFRAILIGQASPDRNNGTRSSQKMTLSIVRDSVAPLLRRLFHMFWRFSRPLTVGVRALVLDGDGRVFL